MSDTFAGPALPVDTANKVVEADDAIWTMPSGSLGLSVHDQTTHF